jgi:hypothetical protein
MKYWEEVRVSLAGQVDDADVGQPVEHQLHGRAASRKPNTLPAAGRPAMLYTERALAITAGIDRLSAIEGEPITRSRTLLPMARNASGPSS